MTNAREIVGGLHEVGGQAEGWPAACLRWAVVAVCTMVLIGCAGGTREVAASDASVAGVTFVPPRAFVPAGAPWLYLRFAAGVNDGQESEVIDKLFALRVPGLGVALADDAAGIWLFLDRPPSADVVLRTLGADGAVVSEVYDVTRPSSPRLLTEQPGPTPTTSPGS